VFIPFLKQWKRQKNIRKSCNSNAKVGIGKCLLEPGIHDEVILVWKIKGGKMAFTNLLFLLGGIAQCTSSL
jgi:hypothetical protein